MATEIRQVSLDTLPHIDQNKFTVILQSAGLTALKGQIFKANPVSSLLGIGALKGGDLKRDYNFKVNSNVDDPDGKSAFFGTPVFSNLVFNAGSYKSNNGTTVNYPKVTLDTVLCDVNMQKNIIKTVVQGRNGSVKEYISNGDYSINIRGGIFSVNPDSYPRQDVNALISICNAPNELEIVSWFLQMFGINNIVIESFDFVQQEGYQSCQLFTMNCVSDEPIQLQSVNR